MGQRSAGAGVRKAETDNNVNFHPFNAAELVCYLQPHFNHLLRLSLHDPVCRVLDACAGDRALGNVFREKWDGLVTYQDIKYDGKSILEYQPKERVDIIICNPPWVPVELPEAIYRHLAAILNPTGVLLFVINDTFCYQGPERAKGLAFNKFYFLPRYTFASSGHALLDCGVMVYHKDCDMNPEAAMLRPFVPLTRIKRQKADMMEEFL